MIIFELETLSDDSHRRHFIEDPVDCCNNCWSALKFGGMDVDYQCSICSRYPAKWKRDDKSYHEACVDDKPISQTMAIFIKFWDSYDIPIQIWCNRDESFRQETQVWLLSQGLPVGSFIQMRPIGDTTPYYAMKERWIIEYYDSVYPKLDKDAIEGTEYHRKDPIQFVFESDPKSIEMWKRRHVFVFNCNQNSGVI